MSTLNIAGHEISRDGPPLVIAEIGVNHDGHVAVARQLIDAAAHAGADAVKFQLFDADLLLAKEAGLVDYQKSSAASAEDLLKPLELSARQLRPLVEYAHECRLAAVITPFSVELVEPARSTGCDALKLASPDLVNHPLIAEVLATSLPVILSSGAATVEEIARTLTWLPPHAAVGLLHCVSSYPTSPEDATLGAIPFLRQRFPQLILGYSDHTTSTLTGALAVAAGAAILEKHLTLDRTRPGPDHAASLEPAQLAEYVSLARRAFQMRGPYDKQILDAERQVRQQTRQSVVLAVDVPANTKLERRHLTVKRPGTGIPAVGLFDLVGRKTVRALAAGDLLSLWDLDDPED